MRDRQIGFTLIELIVVIAIGAILAASAIPSFRSAIRSSASDTIKSNLNMALKLARSEAISGTPRTRGYSVDNVNVCASANGTTCSNDWSKGWMVYVPSVNAGSAPGAVLRYFKADGTFAITAAVNNFIFNSQGYPTSNGTTIITSSASSPTFQIVDNQSIAATQTLLMQASGTITIK